MNTNSTLFFANADGHRIPDRSHTAAQFLLIQMLTFALMQSNYKTTRESLANNQTETDTPTTGRIKDETQKEDSTFVDGAIHQPLEDLDDFVDVTCIFECDSQLEKHQEEVPANHKTPKDVERKNIMNTNSTLYVATADNQGTPDIDHSSTVLFLLYIFPVVLLQSHLQQTRRASKNKQTNAETAATGSIKTEDQNEDSTYVDCTAPQQLEELDDFVHVNCDFEYDSELDKNEEEVPANHKNQNDQTVIQDLPVLIRYESRGTQTNRKRTSVWRSDRPHRIPKFHGFPYNSPSPSDSSQ